MSSNQIAFEYFNRSTDTVDVWLSVAPGTNNVNFSGDIQPISIQDHEFLGSICYFQVPSRQRLKYTSAYSPVKNHELTDEERNYFLRNRSEEHTSELQSRGHLVCSLLLEKKKLQKL